MNEIIDLNDKISDAITLDIRNHLKHIPYGFLEDNLKINAGAFYIDARKITLYHGEFFRELCIVYNRTLEKQVCNTISHEALHYVLLEEHNVRTTSAFDRIAESLAEYGVW